MQFLLKILTFKLAFSYIYAFKLLINNKRLIIKMNESVNIFDLVHEYLSTKGLYFMITIYLLL